MKKISTLIFIISIIIQTQAQNKTEVSLFMRADSIQQTEISAESGDLYSSIGHHGPAIENEWMALRIYFSQKAAIDVYSKAKPQLELRGKGWYPTANEQKEGWGADYYKVGETVGLGGCTSLGRRKSGKTESCFQPHCPCCKRTHLLVYGNVIGRSSV